jgi:hypothetical protein
LSCTWKFDPPQTAKGHLMKVFALVAALSIAAPALAQDFWAYDWFGETPPAPPLPWQAPTSNPDPNAGDLGAGWDVLIHHGNPRYYEPNYLAGPAQHSDICTNATPPLEHQVSTYPDTVFICNHHLMTFANGGPDGYAEDILTPDRMVDFSNGAAEITWMVSTWRASARDWWDVSITPFEDNYVAHGMMISTFDHQGCPVCCGVDLTGIPKNMVQLELQGNNSLMLHVVGSGQAPPFCVTEDAGDWQVGLHRLVPPSSTDRLRFQVIISTTSFWANAWYQSPAPRPPYAPGDCNPGSDGWCAFLYQGHEFNPPLTWSRGIVQFGHHSYNPAKADFGYGPTCGPGEACGGAGQPPCCKPNTWHWENVTIGPAVPFTIINGSPRWVSEATTDTVTFDRPAPANAFLRFEARSWWLSPVQYSLDGGATWNDAQRQSLAPTYRRESTSHMENYWQPIPQGTRSVQLRGFRDCCVPDPWLIRDITIWSDQSPFG